MAVATSSDRALIDLAVAIAVAEQEAVPAAESPYLHDPVGFITERLGEHVWSKQRQIAEAVRDHRRVAVPSAHETGKSFIAARIAAWWIRRSPAWRGLRGHHGANGTASSRRPLARDPPGAQ
jgi:hypothetical protein